MAATPVGAMTIIRLGSVCFRLVRKVVLTVPALAVRKTLMLVWKMNSLASSSWLFCFIIVFTIFSLEKDNPGSGYFILRIKESALKIYIFPAGCTLQLTSICIVFAFHREMNALSVPDHLPV